MRIDATSTSITAILMWNGANATSVNFTNPIRLQDLWEKTDESDGQGFLGLVQIFADMATVSQTIWEEMAAIDTFDCPGVYDYEVSEEWGAWFAKEMGDISPQVPEEIAQKLALGDLLWKFFATTPSCLNEEQFAVITKHTGYTPLKETTFVTSIDNPEPHVVTCGPNVFGPFESERLAHEYAAQHLGDADDYFVQPLIKPNKA